MTENKTAQKDDLADVRHMALVNMHKTFLEALRHREQEILRFLAILAPSLGGFIWLLTLDFDKDGSTLVFTIGTLGVLLFLLLGGIYSLALGYNYRSITLQLAKLEATCLHIDEFILNSWLRTAKEWKKKYRKSWIPYCAPPEIIKVFWLGFVLAKIFVILAACFFLWGRRENMCMIMIGGGLCIIIGVLFAPMVYGWKLYKACDDEPDKWKKSQE